MSKTFVMEFILLAVVVLSSAARAGDLFSPYEFIPVAEHPRGIAVGDFNKDGHQDVAASCDDDDVVSVALAGGPHSFQPYITYYSNNAYDIVCGDFNEDGNLDLVTSNAYVNSLTLHYGRGDGTFWFQRPFGHILAGNPGRMAMGDFNHDNRPDLAVAFSGVQNMVVYQGRVGGGFNSPVVYPCIYDAWHIVSADFNGDQQADLAVLGNYNDELAIYNGRGDGTFEPFVSRPLGYEIRSITEGDFNHDGRSDLALTLRRSPQINVLYAQPDGSFGDERVIPAVDDMFDIVSDDFNEDGLLDLALGTPGDVVVLYGQPDGGFGNTETYPVYGAYHHRLIASDVDLDSHIDLLVTSNTDDNVSILYNQIPEPVSLTLLAMSGWAFVRRPKTRVGG